MKLEFKDTELGLIPSDWNLKPLGELLYIKGRIGWKGLKKSEYLDSGFAIINGEQIKNDEVDWENVGRISAERYDESPEIMLKSGDILMTKDGTIGKIAFIDELPEKATVASGVFVIRKKSELLEQGFLYNFFESHYFKWLIKSRVEGSVIPHLYQRDFQEMKIPLPTPVEQYEINKILESISKKIKLLQAQNSTLESIAQLYFQEVFSDKNSVDWEFRKLEELLHITSSKRIFRNEYVLEGIPFYRSKEVIELSKKPNVSTELFISKERYSEIKNKYEVPLKGDILLTAVGTIGIPFQVRDNKEFYFKDGNLVWFKDFSNLISSDFVYNWLKLKSTQNKIKSVSIGSTQKALTISSIKQLKIPVLLNKEKRDVLKDFLRINLNKVNENYSQIEVLKGIRDTILPKLMSGKIRINRNKENQV